MDAKKVAEYLNHNDQEESSPSLEDILKGEKRMWEEKAESDHKLFQHKMKRGWAEIWPLGFIPEPVLSLYV